MPPQKPQLTQDIEVIASIEEKLPIIKIIIPKANMSTVSNTR